MMPCGSWIGRSGKHEFAPIHGQGQTAGSSGRGRSNTSQGERSRDREGDAEAAAAVSHLAREGNVTLTRRRRDQGDCSELQWRTRT